ncbi:MAG: AEC family transporter [Syntrophorhabdaceae bacterium]|nr:AEC family transporter [Syntrophorhabdaceae bacterium]
MINLIETIAPIFLIILFGTLLKRMGFLSPQFISDANRFVFLFPLPFMIFTGIVKSQIKDIAYASAFSIVLSTLIIFIISFLVGLSLKLKGGRLATFIQTTFHGNVSYIGLAVIFFMLGEEGLKKGTFLIGILILLNNVLAIGVLSWTSVNRRNISDLIIPVIKTPVVFATFLGIVFLYLRIPIPSMFMKSISIVANIALPMALLIIGASITLKAVKKVFLVASLSSIIKLFLLPSLAMVIYSYFSLPYKEIWPGIILLATPTATTSYILAREMEGDGELASSIVALSTIISPLTFILWGYILGRFS